MEGHIAAARDFVLERQEIAAPDQLVRALRKQSTFPGARSDRATRFESKEDDVQARRDVLKALSGGGRGRGGGSVRDGPRARSRPA